MAGKTVALVVAAGKGRRMGGSISKQYLELAGKPILVHTLLAFERSSLIDEVLLVVGAEDLDRCQTFIDRYELSKLRQIIAGGRERQHSVRLGLQTLADSSESTEFVLIHDGVRPFVDDELLERIMHALTVGQRAALVAAIPVKDTIKTVEPTECTIGQTLDRERLWAIQTPQAFRMSLIMEAHLQAEREQYLGTDDAVLAERAGEPVYIVPGDDLNIKVTTPADLLLAEAILHVRQGRSGMND